MSKWMQPFADKHITGKFGTRSAFRIRNGLGAHRGTDWARPNKTPIPAVTSGKIALVQYSKVLGWCIVQTGQAKGKTWYVGYAHLAKKPSLKVGDKIEAGDTIALMGNTGSASSGPHLHATLSTSKKGIFWGKVYDLHKFINQRIAEQGGEPAFVDKVDVKYLPHPSGVKVEIGNAPVGMKVRVRVDGKSVFNRTVRPKDGTLTKTVRLKGEQKVCVYTDGIEVFCQEVVANQASPITKKEEKPVENKQEPKVLEVKKVTEAKVYKVVSGDTLGAIARDNDTTVAELVKINGIKNPNVLSVGQEIKLSEPKEEVIKRCKCCNQTI